MRKLVEMSIRMHSVALHGDCTGDINLTDPDIISVEDILNAVQKLKDKEVAKEGRKIGFIPLIDDNENRDSMIQKRSECAII